MLISSSVVENIEADDCEGGSAILDAVLQDFQGSVILQNRDEHILGLWAAALTGQIVVISVELVVCSLGRMQVKVNA